MFKRIFTLTVALIMIVLAFGQNCTNIHAAEIIELADSKSKFSTETLRDGGCVSTRFNVTGTIESVEYMRDTTGAKGEMTFSLYKWTGSYNETINAVPVAQKTFEAYNYTRGEWLPLEGPFEAGEYIFEIRFAREGNTVTFFNETEKNTTVSYMNHRIKMGVLRLRLNMISGGLKGTGSAIEEDRTTPPEVILPEDHPINTMNVNPTSWAATDGLGRTLSMYGDEYQINVDGKIITKKIGVDDGTKKVGIFYHTWNYEASETIIARNITEILSGLDAEEREKAKHDYDHKVWKKAAGWHFWNQPLFGYYSILDEYVLRKHAELLAAAGVDFIVMDNTNGAYAWEPAYYKLCEVWEQARQEGVKTPQIVFMLNFAASDGSRSILNTVYNDIYRVEKFKDLWFYLDGKPLIMAYTDNFNEIYEDDKEILDFFTFRKPYTSSNYNDTLTEKQSEGYWGWLWKYPQIAFYKGKKVEEVTVAVAENINYTNNLLTAMSARDVMGRSYSGGTNYYYTYKMGDETVTCNSDMENSVLYGINLQQQFDYALTLDPEIMFVTGWNEWIAIRANSIVISTNPNPENNLADQFDDEYSRDIEPSAGILKDYYYYQLVENIRRFKGVKAVPKDGTVREVTVDIHGSTDQWDNVTSFNSYIRSTYDRDYTSFRVQYTNNTMRNDILKAKVAFDNDNFYFYVETVDDLTPETDSAWMRLFIDAGPGFPSWEGYDYVINRVNPQNGKCVLERSAGGWNWQTVSADIDYSVSGKILQIAVPRSLIELENGSSDEVSFKFKWSDNMQEDGNILDFYSNGDVAPTGRFTYCFSSKATVIVPGKAASKSMSPVVIAAVCAGAVIIVALAALLIALKKTRNRSR